jgi:hypothetical protein
MVVQERWLSRRAERRGGQWSTSDVDIDELVGIVHYSSFTVDRTSVLSERHDDEPIVDDRHLGVVAVSTPLSCSIIIIIMVMHMVTMM